jgi:hypothetical protein
LCIRVIINIVVIVIIGVDHAAVSTSTVAHVCSSGVVRTPRLCGIATGGVISGFEGTSVFLVFDELLEKAEDGQGLHSACAQTFN